MKLYNNDDGNNFHRLVIAIRSYNPARRKLVSFSKTYHAGFSWVLGFHQGVRKLTILFLHCIMILPRSRQGYTLQNASAKKEPGFGTGASLIELSCEADMKSDDVMPVRDSDLSQLALMRYTDVSFSFFLSFFFYSRSAVTMHVGCWEKRSNQSC
jgi:hypothetical protein